MAKIDDYLNYTVLGYFYNRIKVVFASATDLSTLEAKVDDIIAEGGEPNVIETVKVDGTALTPDAQKAVNIDLSSKADVADIPTKTSDLTNDGDGTSNFATEEYVDENGGKIDSISVNGDPQTIDQNKNVDLEIPDGYFSIDGKKRLSYTYAELKTAIEDGLPFVMLGPAANTITPMDAYIDTNDSNAIVIKYLNPYNKTSVTVAKCATDGTWTDFVTDFGYAKLTDLPEDLSDLTNTAADPYAKMSDVESAQVGALKPKGSVAFANLPALTAANQNNMYNVTDAFTTTADFIEGAGKSYPAGTNVAIINTGTDASPVYKYDAMVGMTDLSGYWDKTELVAITTAQVDSLFS